MGQKIATLEVELAMATGGAIADVARFGGVVDKVSAQAIRDLDRIDAATKGVGDMSAAEASLVRYAETAARSAISTAREMNRIERAGEAMIAQLDRQIATYGKTSSEIRALKAEEAALAADRANKSELAARIREREQQLYDLEFAAMRRAAAEADALAEEKAAAALAAERQAAAMRAEAAAAQKLATEHAQLAAAVRASHDAQEADARAAERLRAATDPLYAATKRLNEEIAESTRLYQAGVTAPAEYARQQEVLAARLRNVGQASDDIVRKNGRVSSSLTQLSFQGNDIITMYMGGASAGQIFATQAGQIVQVVQMAEGGFWGLARAVGAALIPFAPLIAAAGIVTGGLVLLNKQMNEDSGLKEYAAGLGLTQKEMKKLGDVSVTAGDMIKGLWSVISDDTAFGDLLSSAWKFIKEFTKNFWEVMIGITGGFYTMFVGSYRGIVETWDRFPAAFADIFVEAVNAAIEKLNGLGQATNKLLGVDLFGEIEPLKNGYAGAAKDVGEAWMKAFRDTRKEYEAGVSGFGDAWTKASIKAAEARLKLKADDLKSDRTPKTDSHADQLAREAQAMEAQIRNQHALAEAYGVSGAAALIAEARVKAESQAIKARGDIEAYVDRQVRLAIAQRITDAAKATATMREQAKVQEQVNAMVAAGLVPSAAAAQLVRDQLADLPLLQAIEAARMQKNAADAVIATKALEAQREARDRLNDAEQAARFATTKAANDNELERLALETRLIGANTVERVRQLATLKAWQEAVADNMQIDRALEYVGAQVEIALAQERLAAGQERFNNLLAQSEDAVKRYANAVGESFGGVGRSIAAMTTALINHAAEQRKIDRQRELSVQLAGRDAAQLAQAEARYARASADNQIGAYADIAGAAKGMFSERSKIFKALEAAETAYRAVQLALSIQSMVQNAAETASTIANAGARATADGTAGVAAQSKLPFPLNIAAMAATAAALVGFGITMLGGGGSGGRPTYNEGTGTVFGDSAAESASIKRALDLLADLDTEALVVSRQMAASLKAIESNIGGLTNLVIRLGGADGVGSNATQGVQTGFQKDTLGKALESMFDPFGKLLGIKIPVISDILGGIGSIIGGLFGSKTTVVGQGIYGAPQTIGAIDAMGFDGQTFADIQKKKKFLGVTTSTKYSTQYGALDASLEDQFGKLLLSFADTIKLAAGPLGLSLGEVENKLNSFVVDIGKIDLKGLTGEEIQEKLTAVFGAQADKMAQFVVGGLEKYQQVGEGYFETLVRVASTVEVVTTSLEQLGLASQSLGIDASMAISGFFENAAAYQDAAGRYFEAFYTDAEQAAARSAQLGKVFNSLGITMPDSIAAYRALVEAQDLSTASGQQLYAQLLQLAPAFAEVVSAGQSASSAAAILRERNDLERQLLQMEGKTSEIRAMELAQLDPSNRAIQERIYALQDEATAAQAAAAAAQERAGIERTILQLQGDTAALRAIELDALDPANRALQERVYALQDEAAAAAAAAQVANQRDGLIRQLYEAQGNTAKLREMELNALDPSNRALQRQIWALQDLKESANAAASKARELADAWGSVGDSILDEINRIRGIGGTASTSLDTMLRQFNAANAAARAGDIDAARSLPELSKALLLAAEDQARSYSDYKAIEGIALGGLEQSYKATLNMVSAQEATAKAAERSVELAVAQQNWWKSFSEQQAVATANASAANDQMAAKLDAIETLLAEIAEDQRNGHATIAGNTGKAARILENVTTSTGGDSIAISEAA